ncbi:MAG: dihydrodipicolinate synthase family protein, partial [Planctomycetia bacterium]
AAGVFALGTTGEGPNLSHRLKEEVAVAVCEAAAGRVPVFVGVSDPSPANSLELAGVAGKAGAAAVVATAPFYHPLSTHDLQRYFLRLAEKSPLPVVLYNMPACVRVELDLATVARCTAAANIVGVKDSSGDLVYFRRLLKMRDLRPDWTFYVGPEQLLGPATLAGGDGGVNGGANYAPRLFVDLYDAARRGDHGAVHRLQDRAAKLGGVYQVADDFMAVARGLKCALSLACVCTDVMAEPLSSYDEDRRRLVAERLRIFEDSAK